MKKTRSCSGLSTRSKRDLLKEMSESWLLVAREIQSSEKNIRLRGGSLLLPQEVKDAKGKDLFR